MIAIAGSKGGCGTSTVTLGLAEAFARADTPALAIDGDRQLPNLHVMTETDREPTLAALADPADCGGSTDVRELAQQHPREPTVGVIPAPRPSQTFEFDSVGDRLEIDGRQVLIDCPSGAGPSAVDPLRQADGVIVVASETDRSLEAAETTIEMARRLDVPIYGAILNTCAEIPEPATRWKDVPILGCVPERTSPLLNDEVAAAFDDVVERLAAQSPTDRAPPEYAADRLPIGTDAIDRRLGGGLAPGSVVAFVAAPASQGEHLLHRATGVRGTLYLSTDRSRATVRRELESTSIGIGVGTPTIRRISDEDALEDATSLIGKLPDAATLIVDPIDELERADRSAYVSFLDELKTQMAETGSIAVLHCFEVEGEAAANRSATLRTADAVFELETVAPDAGTDIDHSLSIPKYRSDASVTGTIELEFDDARTVAPIESPPEAGEGGARRNE